MGCICQSCNNSCNQCTCSTPCVTYTAASGCPIQLDFSCILYHKGNNEVTELDGLGLSNGATLELVAESLDEKIKQLAVLDWTLTFLRTKYVINTLQQFGQAVDTELGLVSGANASSGTYTPILTEIAGVSSPTAHVSTYTRVGNIVTVAGTMELAAIGVDTNIEIGVTLPVPSLFTSEYDLNGTVTASDEGTIVIAGTIKGNTTTDVAHIQFDSGPGVAAGTYNLYYTFQYRVI